MKPEEFQFISDLIKEKSGIVLTLEKVYLLESRLSPIARKHGMESVDDVISTIRLKRDQNLTQEVIEALTTNESFFFRDTKPFDLFRDNVLPELVKSRAGSRTLRIWCAAAASGQEPYSLAMILKEKAAELAGWKIEIIGTDISRDILKKAKEGLYSQFEVQRGLPTTLLLKYFEKVGAMWKIHPAIQSMVQFRELNLLDSLSLLGKFDIVFCRNVLIYFDQPTKTSVLEKISALLPKDGMLFLGGAETVLGVSDRFHIANGLRGVYGLKD